MFELRASYQMAGDQPQAVEALLNGLKNGRSHQVLLGVTGSGKTFTMANVITKVQKPTLVISHNKTLAAQLTQEYRDFFPKNAVEYFVSYYDYYQPEAYIPQRDQYIEKEVEINEEIDRLRLSTTASLLTRDDVVVVASVSCIYNLGSPVEYGRSVLRLEKGSKLDRSTVLKQLVDLFYDRNDFDFQRSTFRVRGEFIDVWPAYDLNALRIEFNPEGNLKSIRKISPLTLAVLENLDKSIIYPAKHYVSNRETYEKVFSEIRQDLESRVKQLQKMGKSLEAHRLKQRTEFDLETIKTLGYCSGIENYSRYFDGRLAGQPPYTLLDYFTQKKEWLLIIDESHITVPQIRGMYNGDRSRKQTLIDYGFRLPSAADNRPLRFDEFLRKIPQTIYTSATPGQWEISMAQMGGRGDKEKSEKSGVIEQLVRPTGLLDPEIEIRRTSGQLPDLLNEIIKRAARKERTLVTTLTKRLAEDLSDFLEEKKIKVTYLHSDVETLERTDILDDLRKGNYDVVVGINLLREGLDLPEVSLVAILDADKEGFLRSETSLIQTMGRAARHIQGRVILYADKVTTSMERAMAEVIRRRSVQIQFNAEHRLQPRSVTKPIRPRLIEKIEAEKVEGGPLLTVERFLQLSPPQQKNRLKDLELKMREAAEFLDFELAAKYRDLIREIKKVS